MIKVLFVCLGNICRSPLAEAIFKEKVRTRGWEDKITSNSVGTSNYHIGEDPDERTIEVAVRNGIPIQHKGQQLHYSDAKEYDYFLAMDSHNYRDIIHTLGAKPDEFYLMRDFDHTDTGADVPDPYYGARNGFDEVFDILDRSLDQFLDFLNKKHDL